MNRNQYDYRQYQARRADDLRRAEQDRLAQEASPETFYNQSLAQLGRALTALGQRLQDNADSRSELKRAYR